MYRFALLAAVAAASVTVAAAQNEGDVGLELKTDTLMYDGTNSSPLYNHSALRVTVEGGFVADGILGIGDELPAEGSGERMLWDPYHAAFRAGSIGSGGTSWDFDNIGFYTWAGGYNTTATGLASFAMGYQSRTTGSYSTGIGYLATATGTGGVAMGYRSGAFASYAVSIGQRATNCSVQPTFSNGTLTCGGGAYTGAITFADASTTSSMTASANNQFSVRASGGYRLFTNSTLTTGMTMSAGGSSWNTVSDRNRKEDFEDFDTEAVLQRVAQLPLSTYHYIDGEEGVRHVGPMAQDWQRLVAGPLGLNADSTTINQGDFDGVNLAGVIALEARTSEQAAQIAAQAEEIAALRMEVAALRQTLTAERSGAAGLRETVSAQAARLDALDARLGVVLAALGAPAPEAAPLASRAD